MRPVTASGREHRSLSTRLLEWYGRHRRKLPWRAPPGHRPDPYHVWLSEMMLQQTTVRAVKPYFESFLARWPTIEALAQAPLDDVLHAWQGLGYYARARNLHKCATIVVGERGGRFPRTERELVRLPGIGPYSAAAIAAIAFGRPAVVIDGNVERVMARLFAVSEPLSLSKARLRALAAALTPKRRAGDHAQALMDLGATICTARRPACALCPWSEPCVARREGRAEVLPTRIPAAGRPMRRGVAFWAVRDDGAVLFRRRPEESLLGGMMEVPSTEWRAGRVDLALARRLAPVAARWRRVPGIVRHGFTHFELELVVLAGRVARPGTVAGRWCPIARLDELALPTLTKKIVAHALADARPRRASPPGAPPLLPSRRRGSR